MMQAMIQTVVSGANFMFIGNHAVAAIAAVRAHKMIDAMGAPADSSPDTPAMRVQIPYSSVVLAQFQYIPDDTEVEDDNCKSEKHDPTPEPTPETNSLMIICERGIGDITVTLSDTTINGTYGLLTFTNGVSERHIAANERAYVRGIDDGVGYTISGSIEATDGSLTGTTPASVSFVFQST